MLVGKSFIGNEQIGTGEVVFKTINPKLNQENAWDFIEATENEVDAAIRKAHLAFKSYKETSDKQRADFLLAISEEIDSIRPDVIEVYQLESGLSKERGNRELDRTIQQLELFASFLRSEKWRTTRTVKGVSDLRKTLIPIGPIAVFGSSNFPFAYSTMGGDSASALAAGCPVVVKSHPMHTGTGELIAKAVINAVQKCELPDGVFSNLNSQGIEVGQQIVKHPNIKGVGFTGSIRGGRALFDIAAKRPEPIPVFAEMGSINPVFISSGAMETDADKWARLYRDSITLDAGQFCTNPGLIIVEKSQISDQFILKLANELSKVEPVCMLHPKIKNSFLNNKKEIIHQSNVSLIAEYGSETGNFSTPTLVKVDGNTFLQNPDLHKEVFGSFSIIVECWNKDQIIEVIENLEGQLTGTIVAQKSELNEIKPIVKALTQRVGRLIYNGVPTGVEVNHAMHHGGPYPATTDGRFTAVGNDSIYRWLRPVTFQNFPEELLPAELSD